MDNFPTITYVPINTDLLLNLMKVSRSLPGREEDAIAKVVHQAVVFAIDNNLPIGVNDF